MKLVVVESPAKAKTIEKYLGPGHRVLASFGHIRDLPPKDGSVDPDDGFAMLWENYGDKGKQIKAIADEAKDADTLVLATDPDREGEAISWHVKELLAKRKALPKEVERVTFNAITKEAVKDQAKQVTILLNKPVGYVSGQPEADCKPAVTLISAETWVRQSGDPEFKPWMLRGLAPAGRLDIDSTGLLVFTQDGRVAKKLIGDDSQVEKEYLVRVSGEHGLSLDGKPLRPAWVKQLNEDQLHFILKEGKKRQIRRMCELVGLRVTGLKRVRIGKVRLGDLALGQWRFLRADEAF